MLPHTHSSPISRSTDCSLDRGSRERSGVSSKLISYFEKGPIADPPERTASRHAGSTEALLAHPHRPYFFLRASDRVVVTLNLGAILDRTPGGHPTTCDRPGQVQPVPLQQQAALAIPPGGVKPSELERKSIPTADLPRVRFVAADGAEALLPVEVPPRNEYSIGLSGRHELEGRGMLFYYPSGEATSPFWMRNTHVDLDIAFVDAAQVVIEVQRMLANTDEFHYASRPYLAAIETPAGWYAEHGIGAGARVELLFEIPEGLR
jgi:uncharacterized protein